MKRDMTPAPEKGQIPSIKQDFVNNVRLILDINQSLLSPIRLEMSKKTRHDKRTGVFVRQLDYDKVKKMYLSGRSYSDISHEMNCSHAAVSFALHKMGIRTDRRGKLRRRIKRGSEKV